MEQKSIKTAIRLLIAKYLIRFKRLTHVDYSVDEISQLIDPHLPNTFPISVPTGDGHFTLSTAKISMPVKSDFIQAEVLGSIEIKYLATPIYRAHVRLIAQARPYYDHAAKKIQLTDLRITEIRMINDEYSLLKDTTSLINQLVPSPFMSMVTGTMKTAFTLMTGTTASGANSYLQMYLSGSKQKVLDYHKPQIENLIIKLAASDDMHYTLNIDDFEEGLFVQYGKTVVVEEGQLRFKF